MSPDNTGRIAIIIPVYNVVSFLEAAIASAVTQDYSAKEIIIVDDGSPEDSAERIRHICSTFPGITLLARPHGGVAAARDAGVAHTSAEYILFLDADDLLLPGALQYFSDALHKQPGAVATYARYMKTDAHGNVTGEAKPLLSRMVSGREVLYRLLRIRHPFIVGSICIRREALEKLPANNHGLMFGEDWVLWCHLALSGDIVPAGDRIVMHYRKHDENATSRYVKNPDPVFCAYDAIFKDPAFAASVGEEKLREFEAECLHHTHMRLARYYAMKGNLEKANHHMQRITLPMTSFLQRRKN